MELVRSFYSRNFHWQIFFFPFGSLQAIPLPSFFFSENTTVFNHIVILCTLRASLLLISLCFWVSAVWLSVSKLWLDISRYTILCTLICDFGHKNRNSSRLKRLVIKFTHNALHQVVYTQKLQEKQRVFREENQIKHELPSSKNSQKSHRIKDFF